MIRVAVVDGRRYTKKKRQKKRKKEKDKVV